MVQWGVILQQLVYSILNYHLCYKAKYVTFADDEGRLCVPKQEFSDPITH